MYERITIKNIGEDKITVAGADGQVLEIKNQLAELRTLLENQKVQTVQYADKIYNIENINEANFGMLTGKRPFNQMLTRSIIESIAKSCDPAKRFLEKVASIPEWEVQTVICDKAREVIAYSLVGPIGTQLSKLMAIGKESFSEEKQQKYIEKCLFIAKKSVDLIIFSLLSAYWDSLKKQSVSLSEEQKKILQQRFDTPFELPISEQFRILKTLSEIFAAHPGLLQSPFSEWPEIAAQLCEGSELHQNCQQWESLNTKLDKAQYDILDCAEAERLMAEFFRHFYFFVNYKMASIKNIGYHEVRNTSPHYLHRYLALGIDNKANVDAMRVNFIPETITTDAILMYRGDNYKQNTNLFPFIIDYNTLSFENGAKVCFYQGQNLSDGILEYRFLDNNTLEYVEKKGIIQENSDMNELLLKDENQKIIKMDSVVEQFQAARKAILEETAIDFSDL